MESYTEIGILVLMFAIYGLQMLVPGMVNIYLLRKENKQKKNENT